MGRSEQESRRLAKEKIKALPIYDGSLVPAAAKLTTGEYLTNWITNRHKTSIAATTHRRYASLINVHIIPALGSIKLQAVTKNHVNALMLQMREKGQSARSQQQARAVLSAAFESAMEDDLVASNPVVKSRTITLDSAQIHPFSLAEVQTLLTKTKGVQMQARVRVAVLYALRQGEALGLQWKDVDFTKKTVFIWQQIQKIEGTYQFVKLKKFVQAVPVFMYLTDFREEALVHVISSLDKQLCERVTGITLADFHKLSDIGVFHPDHMDEAIWQFRLFERASLNYLGMSEEEDEIRIGLWERSVVQPK
jgi:integrase